MGLEENSAYFIHFSYGQHLAYSVGDYEAAQEQFVAAISIEDNWAITYWHYAMALLANEQFEEAKTFILKTIKMNEEMPIIRENYAQQLAFCEESIQRQKEERDRAHIEANKAMMNVKKKKKKKKKKENDGDLKNALGISKRNKNNKKRKKVKK